MTGEYMDKILEKLRSLEVIEAADIPNIDLYMDQLTTFMEIRLQNYKRNDEDKIITKTMINNYTKNKVLPVPSKKKYSVEQIAMLIMIYHMKPVLSLNDISLLLKSSAAIKPLELFEAFTKLQYDSKESVEEDISRKIEKIKELRDFNSANDDKAAMLLLALSLILEANTNKLIAEKIIDIAL